jgi:hypothetical protein
MRCIRKIGFVCLGLILTQVLVLAVAATPAATTKPVSRKTLNALYQKGRSREQLGAHAFAVLSYEEILTKTIKIINDPHQRQEEILAVLPFAISAGYRLGLITQYINAGSADKLYEQLRSYKKAQNWVEQILTGIANLQIERGLHVPSKQYNHLYFARAYNRISWAATLLQGNIWKRYFVYMPADAVLMIDISVRDLQKMLNNYQIYDYQDALVLEEFLTDFGQAVQNMSQTAQLTFKLSFCQPQLAAVERVIKNEVLGNTSALLLLYHTPTIQESLALAKTFQNIEEYTSAAATPLLTAVAELQKTLGQRSL